MSTGDQSIYLRSRIAERRGRTDYGGEGGEWSSHPQFMKDGFIKWAESTRPARDGGVEKIPAEKQMPKTGKGIIEDGVALLPEGPLKNMGQFYLKAKEYTPKIKAVLRDKDIQKAIVNGKYADKMEQIAKYMEMVGLGHMKHDKAMCERVGASKSFKEHCGEHEGGRIGMGEAKAHSRETLEEHMEKCLRGGMSLEQTLEALKKKGKAVYDWLKANKATTKAILKSKYLNEDLGTDIPRKVKEYMEMVGLGAPEYEGCPPGYVDDGLTCRKPIKHTTRKQKYGEFEFDMPQVEGGEVIGKKLKGKGRAPSAYAQFVKEFARKHPGPDLMKRAAAAWRSH
jgi:hypothetical protein